jgi:alpha-ketoglutarate-dependent taurine dioxygenase
MPLEVDKNPRMSGMPSLHPDYTGLPTGAHFRLLDESAYGVWRAAKLATYPESIEALRIGIEDLGNSSPAERAAIRELCGAANMAVYDCIRTDPAYVRAAIRAFAAAFGLRNVETHRSQGNDGVVAIQLAASGSRAGYIPYSNLPLSWHTDGYYNFHGPSDCVKAMVLHCVRDADEGGVNALLDHEIAYIRLRDRDPALIEALMHPEAMTIPAGEDGYRGPRPDNTGPVFFIDPECQALVMRYTARKRHVIWRQDAATQAAVNALEDVLASDPLIIRYKLRPGEGIICNNILHNRSGFADGVDGKGRLLYRVRFHDRISL